MANHESEFSAKMKRLCSNRAVIVTVLTLLVATGIIVAVTVSANRAKQPTPGIGADTTLGETSKPAGVGDVTLPVYNGGETQPVGGQPDDDATEGKFQLPVIGKLNKGHDATTQVYSNTMGDYRIHLGLDIATAAEAPVYAVAAGKVEKIWEDAMMGNCVAIAHENDTVSIYKNLSKTLADGIAEGVSVKQGQALGAVGDTAVLEMADEPHLHFEVTVNGLAVDPLDYFSKEAIATLSDDTAYESGAAESTTVAETRPNGK